MQVKSIQIPARNLLAVFPHAAKEDVRYYLNGVCVEVKGGKVIAVATQGHTLAACIGGEALGEDGKPGDDCNVIIPRATIEQIKLRKGDSFDIAIVRGEGQNWRMITPGIEVHFTAIDGRFPDWRAVTPTQFDDVAGTFDIALLNLFDKSDKILNSSRRFCRVKLRQNGAQRSALVGISSSPEFIGVIMPLRNDDVVVTPDWAKHPEPEAKPEQASAEAAPAADAKPAPKAKRSAKPKHAKKSRRTAKAAQKVAA